ncbi:hypothetical protein PIB30_076788, partial [Stylosanthes scabra]|nr:hypothetical protein [Stylosanthes scabra]
MCETAARTHSNWPTFSSLFEGLEQYIPTRPSPHMPTDLGLTLSPSAPPLPGRHSVSHIDIAGSAFRHYDAEAMQGRHLSFSKEAPPQQPQGRPIGNITLTTWSSQPVCSIDIVHQIVCICTLQPQAPTRQKLGNYLARPPLIQTAFSLDLLSIVGCFFLNLSQWSSNACDGQVRFNNGRLCFRNKLLIFADVTINPPPPAYGSPISGECIMKPPSCSSKHGTSDEGACTVRLTYGPKLGLGLLALRIDGIQ